jgi:para-aminobenzoate synthetase component 1
MTLYSRGRRAPLHLRRLPYAADPLPAFAPLAGEPGAVLLQSALPHARFGRHSLWSARPFATLVARGDEVVLRRGNREERRTGDPFDVLAALLEEFRQPPENLPVPFAGGLVGCFGYGLGRWIERVPQKARRDDGFPDLWLGAYDTAVCLDHAAEEAVLVGQEGYDTREAVDGRMADLADAHWEGTDGAAEREPPPRAAPGSAPLASNFTREAYLAAVARAREHIARGDLYQVNLSQRYETAAPAPPFDLYGRLVAASPAPFAAYLNLGDGLAVASASPERFLRLDGRRVETRPVKGTRPRGATPGEDARLRAELEASEKDRAELVMIVDLERNDLGRVCEPGSVEVTEPRVLETYAQVHHGVATVRGALRGGRGRSTCCARRSPAARSPARPRSARWN